MNFTVEVNPLKFLDSNLKIVNGKVETSVYMKPNKMPVHWTFKVPKRYNRNAINGDLNRSYQISMNFDHEKEIIRGKYHLAGFPTGFVDNASHQFQEKLIDKQAEYELIIPDFLFAEPKKGIFLVEIPYCVSNENTIKRFLGKLHSFVHHKFDIAVKWSTKKIRSLFCLKCKNPHPACKISEGNCSCSANYIGEIKRNVEAQWNKHENPNKNFVPDKHLRKFPDHKFDWKILVTTPTNAKLRNILESSMIAYKQPTLNKVYT